MKENSKKIYPQKIKTCMQEIFTAGITENPVPKKDAESIRRKATQYIAMEFKKLGKSQKRTEEDLIEWNMKRVRPSMDEKDMLGVIKWVYENEKELGCTGKLFEDGFCKKDIWGECSYFMEYLRINQGNRHYNEEDYDLKGWPEYLKERFRNGYEADRVYRELRTIRNENGVFQEGIIYAGADNMAIRIRRKEKDFKPDATRILSAIHTLEKVKLVKKVEKGKPGKYRGKANGYVIIYPIGIIPDAS